MLTDLRILLVDTATVWWRLLPQILGVFLLGWLAAELLLKVAVSVAPRSAWLALAILAVSFVSRLVAVVVILRLVGVELGIRDLVPEAERTVDDRDTSLTHLLAVTLLPFLGLYAAFGEVAEVAARVASEQLFRDFTAAEGSILGVLNEAATERPLWLVGIVLVIYLVRRGLDELHERTRFRPLGILVACVEAFLVLIVVMGGIRVLQAGSIWLRDRAFVGWLASVREAILDALAGLVPELPAVVVQVFGFLADEVWPLFWEALTQPVIWLAVAALIYGSQVLSLAELWRRGIPYAARVPGSGVFASYRERLAVRRPGPPRPGLRRIAAEVNQAFLGDLNDKYLPTLHSTRLVLRSGIGFLAAFVLAYAVVQAVGNAVAILTKTVIGGHPVSFWYVWGPMIDLLWQVTGEPLRLCLLAVAFRRCLQLLHERTHERTRVAASAPSRSAPSASAVPRTAA